MSDLSKLTARVEALEKAVQSLLGAVKIMETIQEGGLAGPAKKTGKSAAKKRAPKTKRVEKS
ncbi:hypothetical protein [Nibricoccus aquaticus]|nr:hypothetical protein [Nibricoccus aquaticus]